MTSQVEDVFAREASRTDLGSPPDIAALIGGGKRRLRRRRRIIVSTTAVAAALALVVPTAMLTQAGHQSKVESPQEAKLPEPDGVRGDGARAANRAQDLLNPIHPLTAKYAFPDDTSNNLSPETTSNSVDWDHLVGWHARFDLVDSPVYVRLDTQWAQSRYFGEQACGQEEVTECDTLPSDPGLEVKTAEYQTNDNHKGTLLDPGLWVRSVTAFREGGKFSVMVREVVSASSLEAARQTFPYTAEQLAMVATDSQVIASKPPRFVPMSEPGPGVACGLLSCADVFQANDSPILGSVVKLGTTVNGADEVMWVEQRTITNPATQKEILGSELMGGLNYKGTLLDGRSLFQPGHESPLYGRVPYQLSTNSGLREWVLVGYTKGTATAPTSYSIGGQAHQMNVVSTTMLDGWTMFEAHGSGPLPTSVTIGLHSGDLTVPVHETP